MTHREAFSHEASRRTTDCDGELIDGSESFSSDVSWHVFTCARCLATIFTVGGRVHWWNHEGVASKSRRMRQAEMERDNQDDRSPQAPDFFQLPPVHFSIDDDEDDPDCMEANY